MNVIKPFQWYETFLNRVLDFIAVVQCDYSEQMDVFRWILNDASYACIWIRHDKDSYTQEDISERATDGAELHHTEKW